MLNFFKTINLKASIKTLLLRFCANFRRMKAHSPGVAQNDLSMKNSNKLGNRSAQLFLWISPLIQFSCGVNTVFMTSRNAI